MRVRITSRGSHVSKHHRDFIHRHGRIARDQTGVVPLGFAVREMRRNLAIEIVAARVRDLLLAIAQVHCGWIDPGP